MKRFVCCLLALMIPMAMAEMGVQMIASPIQEEPEEVNLDDIKLGKEIKIDGYGVIKPLECKWVDTIRYGSYVSGATQYFAGNFQSGAEAQYLFLIIEILNTQYKNASYIDNAAVKTDFGDGYVFGGWKRQFESATSEYVYHDANAKYEISPLYKGKYAFMVTLPNFVVDSPDPLSITVTLTEDIVLTYHVRK